MKNFKRPKDEKPLYYSTTVENGKIIKHKGDPKHAEYKSEMDESNKRANLWHKWVEKNYKKAYNNIGIINQEKYNENTEIVRQFMDGERTK